MVQGFNGGETKKVATNCVESVRTDDRKKVVT